jgi:hypothetical protein
MPTISRSALLLFPLLGFPALTVAENFASERGRIDYILHCSGCHAQDGRGLETKGIPPVKDQIGYYLRLPEGRAFIMQVPGLLSAGMPDERAAGVMNWMIEYFAGRSMPADFVPYTAAEARRYRETRPADVAGTRKALAARLVEMGYPLR